jgi:hypothetical protein
MKPFGGGSRLGAIPQTKAVNALECLHYVMHLPVSTIVTGIPSETVLEQALEAARSFQPWSQGEMARLLQSTRPFAENGQHERYKTG